MFKNFSNDESTRIDSSFINRLERSYLKKKKKPSKEVIRKTLINISKRDKIITKLTSDRYRKYFFKSVNYQPKNSNVVNNKFKQIIITFLGKTLFYLIKQCFEYCFNRKKYQLNKRYVLRRDKYRLIQNKCDEYIANTSFYERNLDRLKYGLITNRHYGAVNRLMNIKSKRVINLNKLIKIK